MQDYQGGALKLRKKKMKERFPTLKHVVAHVHKLEKSRTQSPCMDIFEREFIGKLSRVGELYNSMVKNTPKAMAQIGTEITQKAIADAKAGIAEPRAAASQADVQYKFDYVSIEEKLGELRAEFDENILTLEKEYASYKNSHCRQTESLNLFSIIGLFILGKDTSPPVPGYKKIFEEELKRKDGDIFDFSKFLKSAAQADEPRKFTHREFFNLLYIPL